MTFARRVFALAGVYGLASLTPMCFLERYLRACPPPVQLTGGRCRKCNGRLDRVEPAAA